MTQQRSSERPVEALASEDSVESAMTRVREMLSGHAPIGIAYSGGVDSATLLALAVAELGAEGAVAILGVSPSLPAGERARAHSCAQALGARVVEVETREGENPAYRANGPDRCFHCRDELFTRISDDLVAELGLRAIAYGENADDSKRIDRPGAGAATKHAILRPLRDAGMTKDMVRRAARLLHVEVADKPAAPCLASRIPHFQEVTPEKLRQVDLAESGVRALGFGDLRVRHHGDVARIELRTADIERAATLHREIHSVVTAAGFRFAALDLLGIQSGAFTIPLMEAKRHD